MAAGPCAFGPDGAVTVAAQVAFPDYRALTTPAPDASFDVSALLLRYDGHGELLWARAWQRLDTLPALAIMPLGLTVDGAGQATWAGQTCQRSSPFSPSSDGGYYNSCLDAFVASVDLQGNSTWSLSFGTSDGLERISDLRPAHAGGLYLAGQFQGPLELPGHAALASRGGIDHFLLRMDAEHNVRWARTWGSEDHDGDGPRIATGDDASQIAVTGHVGLSSAGFPEDRHKVAALTVS